MNAERVEAYARELPRLLARENLRWADVVAFGNGVMSKYTRHRVERRWKELAREGESEPAAHRLNVKLDRNKLSGFGLGVRNAGQ